MSVAPYGRVRLLVDVDDEGSHVPAATVGTVVEVLGDGEAYLVDVTVSGESDNIYVTAAQVEPVPAAETQ
jgi:hypothetical protein